MNILITGATSGIGRELAYQLHAKGHHVALTGRRGERLQKICSELGGRCSFHALDVTELEKAEKVYNELIEEMGGLDVIILNAGVGRIKTHNTWQSDQNIIEVNALAFAHGCHFAFNYFDRQGHGQIVGISSMAAHLYSGRAAAYTATKHFISTYMTGYRQKANITGNDITVTDVRAGYIHTEMTELNKNMFWTATTEKAVRQMISGIEKKKNKIYVTRRWRLLAWVAELVPAWVWDRMKA